ncbi:hypothetical protein [Bacillus sp. FJAT-49736]|uniref:hypothetical protein n=1 Tax=Bacillus sp. FJAT-49736 TaxID=2833582 RepID=UPI001BC994CC|nr:hypothetical protein [Bacillus sp. FJAT-49736]MBS4172291.1 hypothetical protein [Bacillus sp. FJAT-49736]
MKKVEPLEAILWSIALPGFAQLLSGSLVKGILFILLEFLINVKSNFNEGIMLSFLGETVLASEKINYQWLMFYPCLYMYAMWDAYKTAQGKVKKYSYLPFAFGAYFVTIGLMYSPLIKIHHFLIGPIFLPILFLIPGIIIGNIIASILKRNSKSST